MRANRIINGVLSASLAMLLVATPGVAGAHCCKEVASTRLQPVDPVATPRLRGRAVVLDCFGVISMLSVVVNSPEPDGTSYAPALVGAEPILGDFFSLTSHRGEGLFSTSPPRRCRGGRCRCSIRTSERC